MGSSHGGDRRIWRIDEVAESLKTATEDLKSLQERMGSQGAGDSQHDGAAVNRTLRSPHRDGTPEVSPPQISKIEREKVPMVPKRLPEEPSTQSFAGPSPLNTLPREVHMDLGHTQIKDRETTESPVDGHDQPKIYTIRDRTLEVLMHPSVLELHAVKAVHTTHADKWQLHLKVRVPCGKREGIADVFVDTGAKVSFVRRGLFSDEFLKPSWKPVRLKTGNGKIMGGGTLEGTIVMKFGEHDRLNRHDLAQQIVLSRNFDAADVSDWDIIMGYDFMVSNAIGALPHRATLVREDKERLIWLSTDHAPGLFQWTRDEEERIVRTVKTVSAQFKGDRGGHLMEYGMAPPVYYPMVQ